MFILHNQVKLLLVVCPTQTVRCWQSAVISVNTLTVPNVYICFSYNKDQHALLLFFFEWRPIQDLNGEAQSPDRQSAKFVWWRSLDVPPLWRGVCEFSILIPECNRASPCQENRWRIEARSITPPPAWTVRMFYMQLSPSCSLMKKESVKALQTTCDMLMFQAS